MKQTISAREFNQERSVWLRKILDGQIAELVITYHGRPGIKICRAPVKPPPRG